MGRPTPLQGLAERGAWGTPRQCDRGCSSSECRVGCDSRTHLDEQGDTRDASCRTILAAPEGGRTVRLPSLCPNPAWAVVSEFASHHV